MLLTETLIDELHGMRTGMMERSVLPLKTVRTDVDGKAIGGGFAIFAGDSSPLTQAYGLNHRGAEFDLAEVENFFEGRSRNWELIVTPFAPSLLKAATQWGYIPDHFETVLAQTVNSIPGEIAEDIEIEDLTDNPELWMKVTEAGWMDSDVLPEKVEEITSLMAAFPSRKLLARLNGVPAAGAGLNVFHNKGVFAGATTLPQFRGRGLQKALSQHRLALMGPGAHVQVVALPGLQSHRNLQRLGFEPLYSKLVLMRREP